MLRQPCIKLTTSLLAVAVLLSIAIISTHLPADSGATAAHRTGTIDVVLCSDSRSLHGLLATINSIFVNSATPSRVNFHVLLDSDASMQKVQLQKEKHFAFTQIHMNLYVFPEHLLQGVIRVRGRRHELATPVNYARFFVPQLLPQIQSRFVYVDTDVIVQGDIAELAHLPMDPHQLLLARQDCSINSYGSFLNFSHPAIVRLNIDPKECSFNAGVLVGDVRKWRQNDVTEQLLYWTRLNTHEPVYGMGTGGGGSQPPMLIVFHQRQGDIPHRWHVRHLGWWKGDRLSDEELNRAKLLHWNGKNKPWINPSGNKLSTRIWLKYALQ